MRTVGVLALQGDVREHVATLENLGAAWRTVRRPEELEGLDGLIIPGGESTTISHLLVTSGLREPLEKLIVEGLPVFGTCAGLIMLASEVIDGRSDQWGFAALDVAVRRNGYGRQIASFETPIVVEGRGTVPGVFIRAPRIVHWGDGVSVIATHDHGDGEHPVLVRQGSAWGCSFHPELTSDVLVHSLFLDALQEALR
ncbi:MAG: pyridoxal 5'-phosphate synthase glutaminase subunit PdxT [Actinomycetota bacterium]|jgi:5'-phosphate synthase pdxT subunit|nr:pyridoxal 5'-phosphate synthase glutaminase subunit PdxT [Actinomycetota bacterium]